MVNDSAKVPALLSVPGELRNNIYQLLGLSSLAKLNRTSKAIHQEVNGLIWETWFTLGSLHKLGVSGEPRFCLHTASLVQNLLVPVHVWSQLWTRVLVFWLRVEKFFPSLKRVIVQETPTGEGNQWVENVYLELVKSCPSRITLGWIPQALPRPWSYQDFENGKSEVDDSDEADMIESDSDDDGGYALDDTNSDTAMPDMFLRSFLAQMDAEDGEAWLKQRARKLQTVSLPPYGAYEIPARSPS
jgi:hypothetical protein